MAQSLTEAPAEAYRTDPQLPRSEKQETRQSPQIRFKPDLKNRRSDVFMTPEVTFLGRGAQNIAASQKNRGQEAMVYTTDDGPLLGLWTAIRLIGVIHEIEDPMARAEIVTQAQILMTAFCAELKPQPWDQISSAPFITGLDEVEKCDA